MVIKKGSIRIENVSATGRKSQRSLMIFPFRTAERIFCTVERPFRSVERIFRSAERTFSRVSWTIAMGCKNRFIAWEGEKDGGGKGLPSASPVSQVIVLPLPYLPNRRWTYRRGHCASRGRSRKCGCCCSPQSLPPSRASGSEGPKRSAQDRRNRDRPPIHNS